MAGHSKWANIQHRKKSVDAKRGKLFTKLIRTITVAAREGGRDPSSNPRLRDAMDKAFASNMTKDTIERAVKRGVGGEGGARMEECVYEGYGPGGTAIMVFCLTDNRNRTVADVRHLLDRHGGKLGTDGSVAYLFSVKGSLVFAPGADEEKLMNVAIDSGASDVKVGGDGSIDVTTDEGMFHAVKNAMESSGLQPEVSEVVHEASVAIQLEASDAESLLKLVDELENLDDVQNVYTNAKIPD